MIFVTPFIKLLLQQILLFMTEFETNANFAMAHKQRYLIQLKRTNSQQNFRLVNSSPVSMCSNSKCLKSTQRLLHGILFSNFEVLYFTHYDTHITEMAQMYI